MKILIVEDDLKIQNFLIKSILEIENIIQVKTSTSSEEALKIAKNYSIDIFILDIQLIDYKGTQLAKQIRELDKYKYTPIIFATVLANEELSAYREIKCYSFLIKPFTKEEIKKALKEAIDYNNSIKHKTKNIRIEQKSQIFEYDINDIIYIESFRKRKVIHVLTVDKEVIANTISGYSLKSLLKLIDDNDFIQPHRSYIINKRYLQTIEKDKNLVKLKHIDMSIPIGNKFKSGLYI